MKKYNLALFYGGTSGERNVSIESANVVKQSLNPEIFNVYPIDIQKDKWIYYDKDKNEFLFDRNFNCLQINETKIYFDIAFIAIHGSPGEDGKLQGYLEMVNIPYCSSNLTCSAITFDKNFCNIYAQSYGLNVAKTLFFKKDDKIDVDKLVKELDFPFFIKPNKSGSSCGITKVYNAGELNTAFDFAFNEDDEVLVQQTIKGREIACGVYKKDDELIALPLTEIVSFNDFFDYEAKYTKGKSNEITPAPISEELTKECQELSKKIYRYYNCKGVVRIDFFLTENDSWWFLEINTIPGFSEASIVPQQVVANGTNLKDFFNGLVLEYLKK